MKLAQSKEWSSGSQVTAAAAVSSPNWVVLIFHEAREAANGRRSSGSSVQACHWAPLIFSCPVAWLSSEWSVLWLTLYPFLFPLPLPVALICVVLSDHLVHQLCILLCLSLAGCRLVHASPSTQSAILRLRNAA